MKKIFYLLILLIMFLFVSTYVMGQVYNPQQIIQKQKETINKVKEAQREGEGETPAQFKTMDDLSNDSNTNTGAVNAAPSETPNATEGAGTVGENQETLKSTTPDFAEDKSLVKTEFRNLFTSSEAIERLLGGKPRFIYDAKNRPDPMLIPWIKAEEEAKNLLAKASIEMGSGNTAAAKEIYKSIIDRFPDTPWAQNAMKIIQDMEQKETGATSAQVKPTLPPEIVRNLTGILWDEKKPLVVIGDTILGIGETVPNTEVVVKDIKKQVVIFSVKGQDFPVQLEGR